MRVEINRYIVADSQICHGKPTFKGTRIMIWQVLEMLEAGMTPEQIRDSFPSINRAHIKAALSYAAALAKGRDNVIASAPLQA